MRQKDVSLAIGELVLVILQKRKESRKESYQRLQANSALSATKSKGDPHEDDVNVINNCFFFACTILLYCFTQ
jgi:hypothetical protein